MLHDSSLLETICNIKYTMVNDNIWKDILDWETDIHKKDEALLRRKPVHDQVIRIKRFFYNSLDILNHTC